MATLGVVIAPPVSAAELESEVFGDDTDQQRLLRALHILEIPVYRPEDVAIYKAAKTKAVPDLLYSLVLALASLVVLSAIVALVAFATGGFLWMIGDAGTYGASMAVSGYALSVATVAGFAWYLLYGVKIKTLKWKRSPYCLYTRDIPGEASTRHDLVAGRLPEAKFCIDELVAGQEILDPLLWVKLGDAEYCIAVWDEPGFNAPLLH